jgi:hypothetical protein
LFGTGLVRTPALYREWEECIARRFRQLLELAKEIPIARNPLRWAEAATLEVLQPFSDDRELVRVFRRVYDEELLRAKSIRSTGPQPTTVRQRSRKKLTRRQQALATIAEIWQANPEATFKEIREFADKSKVRTPWDDCPTWAVAAANRESACKTLCAKARAMSRECAR